MGPSSGPKDWAGLRAHTFRPRTAEVPGNFAGGPRLAHPGARARDHDQAPRPGPGAAHGASWAGAACSSTTPPTSTTTAMTTSAGPKSLRP